jgi:hypothetical protein
MKFLMPLFLLISSSISSASPELPYELLEKDGAIELRQYQSFITASVSFKSVQDMEDNGFKILADYIFGNNISMTSPVYTGEDIGMTSPVYTGGEDIGMTSPVYTGSESREWTMTFVMPSRYTMETLPKPVNKAIKITEVAPKVMATIRFNGRRTQARTSRFEKKLRSWIKANRLNIIGSAVYAGHNPPWTLPSLRRNEVLFQIVD